VSKRLDIKRLVASFTSRLGILDAYALLRRKVTQSDVAVMLYHRVSPSEEEQFLGDALTPEIFERQMEYFHRNYEPFSLYELIEYIQLRKHLPERAVVVTFDDGYRDNYLYAYPILERYNIPATIFLATGHIGTDSLFWWNKVTYAIHHTSIKRLDLDDLGSYSLQSQRDKSHAGVVICKRLRKLHEVRRALVVERLLDLCQVGIRGLGQKLFLSWNEVREMDSEGITFGAHSVSHRSLTNMPLDSARNEIIQSKKDIEENLGMEVTAFSYPFGDYDTEVVRLVRESGFKCAVSVLPYKLISFKDNVYCLQRIPAVEDFNKLKGMLCGLVGDVQACIGLAQHPRGAP